MAPAAHHHHLRRQAMASVLRRHALPGSKALLRPLVDSPSGDGSRRPAPGRHSEEDDGMPCASASPSHSPSTAPPTTVADLLPRRVTLTGRCWHTVVSRDNPAVGVSNRGDLATQAALFGGANTAAVGDVELRLTWTLGEPAAAMTDSAGDDRDITRSWGLPAAESQSYSTSRMWAPTTERRVVRHHEGRVGDPDAFKGSIGEVTERLHTLDGFTIYNQQRKMLRLKNMPYGVIDPFLLIRKPAALMQAAATGGAVLVPVPLMGVARALGVDSLDFANPRDEQSLRSRMEVMIRVMAQEQRGGGAATQQGVGGATAASSSAACAVLLDIIHSTLERPRYFMRPPRRYAAVDGLPTSVGRPDFVPRM